MSKQKAINDPHATREAAKYSNPIPSREFILEHLENRGEPAQFNILCRELQLESHEACDALDKRLNAMCRAGQVICSRAGTYGLVIKMDLVKGRVMGNKDGFGFLIPEGGGGDLYLSPRQMQKVFDGDTVLARVDGEDRRGRKEGKIVEVLEHKSSSLVGRFYKEAGAGVVVPHNKRISHEILISKKHRKGAKDGDFVMVEVTRFPEGHRKATGEIVEVLGDVSTPGMEIDVALRAHDIPHEWPAGTKKELARLPDAPEKNETRHRVDYRNLPFVTIDGEDAKDFDDAVYCERTGKGSTLYVAIADVSHYVGVGSVLDNEARNRGNSVYFPGHVVPMLPEQLSNGLCSLRPDVDRLVMVCKMDLNNSGTVTGYQFSEGVIHSHARMTYTEVAALIQKPANDTETHTQQRMQEKYAAVGDDIKALYELYLTLRQSREKRGALDFETVETRMVFTKERKLAEILEVERNDAHRLIEECMLCANVCTAQLFLELKQPALYRVHVGPNPEKVENLYDFLRGIGIGLARKENPTTTDYQIILKRLAERPDRLLLQTMVIRSLMQAIYDPDNIGHFGLGFDAYTHFTSPIRRYPDLLVHRAIRHLIRSKTNIHLHKVKGASSLNKNTIYPYGLGELSELGGHLSGCERRADAASYDVVDWLKCEYIQQHIGDSFDGTITTVTNFGVFVELDNIHIDGLVHVTALRNDYYHFDQIAHTLTGERTGDSFHLGDRVQVQVSRVDMENHKIDLQLLEILESNKTSAPVPQRDRQSQRDKKPQGKGKTRKKIRKKKGAGQNPAAKEKKTPDNKSSNKNSSNRNSNRKKNKNRRRKK
ncbi:MAG: ribonuclease R [Gammaproteobacteria bacterium]|nr:ribonuclease R [Gammaproteobacteria bacterium]